MDSNTLEATPDPTSAAVKSVIVLVLPVEMPVRTDFDPLRAIPTFEDSQPVQMATNSFVTSPEPTVCTVVVITLPEVPVSSDSTPSSLNILPKSTMTILVEANAPVRAPGPL